MDSFVGDSNAGHYFVFFVCRSWAFYQRVLSLWESSKPSGAIAANSVFSGNDGWRLSHFQKPVMMQIICEGRYREITYLF
ncbi:MAG: hypothetical protein WA056_05840 [Gallionella sp.]|nr:hypothetical protein [Gallionella sp.]MCK9355405.1 hypothetical protein [Gallionella sp.]